MVIEFPDELVKKVLLPNLRHMREMYEDEDRDDWWEADDVARDVAELVLDKLEAACEE